MSLLPANIHPSWEPLLSKNFINNLATIENELNKLPIHTDSKHSYFPEKENVMRFLQQDLANLKYIILGMDPYPSWYTLDDGIHPVATGRSFEIGNVNSWQQKFKQNSLQNIVKTIYYNKTGRKLSLSEIRNKLEENKFILSPPHQWFDQIEQQGVLFLNATLTVTPGCPDSHTNLWQPIMTEVIQYINEHHTVKWLLFGDKAQKRILNALGCDYPDHACCHPRLSRFVDANIFKLASDINWCI